jgi:hypothetical protein
MNTHKKQAIKNQLARKKAFQPQEFRTETKVSLPKKLKSNLESLSGYAMDDVQVHYNSLKPAYFHTHAYAQGNTIYLGPGKEKYLAHEAWHVVQQKQGRVKPTLQLRGNVYGNNDALLEKEADVMGALALQLEIGELKNRKLLISKENTSTVIQAKVILMDGKPVYNIIDELVNILKEIEESFLKNLKALENTEEVSLNINMNDTEVCGHAEKELIKVEKILDSIFESTVMVIDPRINGLMKKLYNIHINLTINDNPYDSLDYIDGVFEDEDVKSFVNDIKTLRESIIELLKSIQKIDLEKKEQLKSQDNVDDINNKYEKYDSEFMLLLDRLYLDYQRLKEKRTSLLGKLKFSEPGNVLLKISHLNSYLNIIHDMPFIGINNLNKEITEHQFKGDKIIDLIAEYYKTALKKEECLLNNQKENHNDLKLDNKIVVSFDNQIKKIKESINSSMNLNRNSISEIINGCETIVQGIEETFLKELKTLESTDEIPLNINMNYPEVCSQTNDHIIKLEHLIDSIFDNSIISLDSSTNKLIKRLYKILGQIDFHSKPLNSKEYFNYQNLKENRKELINHIDFFHSNKIPSIKYKIDQLLKKILKTELKNQNDLHQLNKLDSIPKDQMNVIITEVEKLKSITKDLIREKGYLKSKLNFSNQGKVFVQLSNLHSFIKIVQNMSIINISDLPKNKESDSLLKDKIKYAISNHLKCKDEIEKLKLEVENLENLEKNDPTTIKRIKVKLGKLYEEETKLTIQIKSLEKVHSI